MVLLPSITAVPAPPPRRLEGQTVLTPQGPATLGPGTDRIQQYSIPGGPSGTAIIDGNNTTLISPTAPTQVVPTPR